MIYLIFFVGGVRGFACEIKQGSQLYDKSKLGMPDNFMIMGHFSCFTCICSWIHLGLTNTHIELVFLVLIVVFPKS